jgi:DNA polymerase-3 subunit epsilon
MSFLAVDFETADYGRDSACAVGLATVEGQRVVDISSFLIRPPRARFVFSYIHGITWDDVKYERTFRELWEEIEPLFARADFIAAHNASFDAGVLRACCVAAGIEPPAVSFRCTMRLSRSLWGIRPTTLPDVCRKFRIPLRHHDATSDTLACAKIMIEILKCQGDAL